MNQQPTTETTARDEDLYAELAAEAAELEYRGATAAEEQALVADAGVDYADWMAWGEAQADAYYTSDRGVWAGAERWV